MEEWKEYKLGEITVMKNGKKRPFDNGHYPVYGGNGIMDYSGSYNAENAIIVGRVGAYCGCVYRCDHKCWVSDNAISVSAKEMVDTQYLYYLMTTLNFHHHHIGGAQPLMTQDIIGDFNVYLPSLAVQKNIASILKSLDDKIEINRRINENLEQQAQALFKSWFVDFEPFKDGEFVESELGMIPKGWRVYSMDELVETIGGYSYKGSELQISTTAMATIKNFERNGGFKINGFKEIIPSPKAKCEQFLNKFDIIIAHTDITQNADIIGNPALVLHLGKYDRIIMSMDLVKVKSKCDYMTYGLLYSLFADARFKGHALGYVNGTTVLHLSKKAIPEYKLALPQDLSCLKNYGKTFDLLFAKEAEILAEIERLAELRDTLLPRLMSGELKVDEINL